MSDDTTNVAEPQAGEQEQEPQAPQPKMFDEAYVKELRQEAASNRIKLREFEQKQKEAEEAQLAEQKKWQELAEKRAGELQELAPYKQRYETMLETIAESNKRRIESIPENMRGLVPEYDDPAKVASWLDANAQLLSKPLAPELNGEAGNGERPTDQVVLTEEQMRMARRMNLSAKEYKEAMRT